MENKESQPKPQTPEELYNKLEALIPDKMENAAVLLAVCAVNERTDDFATMKSTVVGDSACAVESIVKLIIHLSELIGKRPAELAEFITMLIKSGTSEEADAE